jgi:glycolate oxidase iron-sulfur subunit
MTNDSPTATLGVDLQWLADRIDYRRFQECVHCGLCTASCPTYLVTSNENDSPRGRIYLMRAVTDGRAGASDDVRKHLGLCLDCRACETACPSGVKYGQLIEPYKIALQASRSPGGTGRVGWLLRAILHHLFPYPRRVRLALAPVRALKAVGLYGLLEKSGLFRILPRGLQGMATMLPTRLPRAEHLPEWLPAMGPRRARVALFTGCVSDVMFPATNAATARVLQRNGCDVLVPRTQACCGAIHYHSGAERPALDLARRNVQAFPFDDVDAVIVNAAGCGAMLKEYGHLLQATDPDASARFAAKVRDVAEFLIELGPVPPTGSVPLDVAYHDACHLCHAQKVRSQPRQLLAMIPGLRLVPLAESEVCCGAAGTYNLTQPEMSRQLGERKLAHIEQTGAAVVATGNVGCILQIARIARDAGNPVDVVHPIDLLDRAYTSVPPEPASSPPSVPRREAVPTTSSSS